MRCRRGLAQRVFEYAAGLFAEHWLPVASTVIVLKPPAPRSLAHEERVGGRVECRRAIRVVRLWRMKPAAAMRLGVGGAALVGLMGRRDLRVVEAAARRIRADSSPTQLGDLWAVLRMLSEGRYTARELQRIVPREVVMGSSLVAWVKKRSRAEGELAAARALCADFVKQHHPGSLPIVAPIIAGCADMRRLREWALAAPRSSEGDFVRLVTASPSAGTGGRGTVPSVPRTTRRRAPAPSRRSRRR